MTADDDRFTITGPNAWAVTGTCTLCGAKTDPGYATAVRVALEKHLATHHPARTVLSPVEPDREPCPCGALYIGSKRGSVWNGWVTWHKQHQDDEGDDA